jgi:two-component system invasion response regulator UvrY
MNIDTMQNSVALVVDDHDAVRHALCDRIKASFGQLRLREAGSVDEALKIVDAEKVDIVLMDIHMPGMDGIDGTRMLLEHSPHTSVIVVSIFDDVSHRAAASKAGASAYVCKRSIHRELIPTFESLMNCGHLNGQRSQGQRENLSV